MVVSSVLESVSCDGRMFVCWGEDDLLVLNLIQSSKIDDCEPDYFDDKSDYCISNSESVEKSEIIIV